MTTNIDTGDPIQIANERTITLLSSRREAPWPQPIAEAALHGLPGDIVRAIDPHTESDKAAILFQLLAALGNAVGRAAYYLVESTHHYPVLYCVIVGKSSRARKGTACDHVLELFKRADGKWTSDCVKSGLSSGEGLIYHLRDASQSRPIKRPGNRAASGEDAGTTEKRLFVIESEFGKLLKVCGRDKNTTSDELRQAWDGKTLQTLSKNEPLKATNAHVSLVGHVTIDDLKAHLTSTDAANGFANRFLFVCAQRSKSLPHGGNLLAETIDEMASRLTTVLDKVRAFATRFPDGIRLEFDDEARLRWDELYPILTIDREGLFGCVTSRAEAQTVRLALIYALFDCSEVITLAHLNAACAAWQYADESASHVFGGTLGDALADDLLRALRQRSPSGMTRTDIRDHFHKNRSAEQIGRALEILNRHGLAKGKMIGTDGRSAEMWFAC